MPTGLMKSLAARFGTDAATVESHWNACSKAIKPDSQGGGGYGSVVDCVKSKLRKSSGGGKKTTTPTP